MANAMGGRVKTLISPVPDKKPVNVRMPSTSGRVRTRVIDMGAIGNTTYTRRIKKTPVRV